MRIIKWKLKFISQIAAIVISLLIVVFIVVQVFKGSFSRERRVLKIDDTITLVEEINKIAQLFTVRYYDEMVLDTFKFQQRGTMDRIMEGLSSPNPFQLRHPQSRMRRVDLVVIARGELLGGYDFSRLTPNDMYMDGRHITLHLPDPEILEVIINPSDFEIFIEEGNWTLEETTALQQRAASKFRQRAMERGIFEQGEATAVNTLREFLFSLGFEQVTIHTGAVADPDDLPAASPSLE